MEDSLSYLDNLLLKLIAVTGPINYDGTKQWFSAVKISA